MNTLQAFVTNEPVKKAVKDYLTEYLKETIINRAFQGKEVKDIAEAKKVIDKAFSNLEATYAKKKTTTQNVK